MSHVHAELLIIDIILVILGIFSTTVGPRITVPQISPRRTAELSPVEPEEGPSNEDITGMVFLGVLSLMMGLFLYLKVSLIIL